MVNLVYRIPVYQSSKRKSSAMSQKNKDPHFLTAEGISIPVHFIHTLVIGSGAAGLNAAVQLHNRGLRDLLILTEGLDRSTSINTGSDKQTYYKLSLCGDEPDSIFQMACDISAAGSMHGDLALVEAGLSARAFLHLVNLGIQFPQNKYGQFIGYKTDHDPRRRATSIGPYTSREMCRALIERITELAIPVQEDRQVVEMIKVEQGGVERAAGVITVDSQGAFEIYGAENIIFAVGGPAGLYENSVYPASHFGGIGLALMIGAKAQSLPESQFGIASTKVRWVVSGSFMQSIPRFISTAPDGVTDEREFLNEYFDSPGRLHSLTFFKGYQWPFDARKAINGSSILDILVYIETIQKGRRVFLDYRTDPSGYEPNFLDPEVLAFLKKSNADAARPIERLRALNPDAYAFYLEHGIDLQQEPLEVGVCAQHNNGGLAANIWWESENIRHLFPIGEVNGSHGVARPGGTALNSGQVGGFRAADYIFHRYAGWTINREDLMDKAQGSVEALIHWTRKSQKNQQTSWQREGSELKHRMSAYGGHIRHLDSCRKGVQEARQQWLRIQIEGCGFSDKGALWEALRIRHLCFAQLVYLEAILYQLESNVGSRGSSIVLQLEGVPLLSGLSGAWNIQEENKAYQSRVLETVANSDTEIHSTWVPKREVPEFQSWFETDWERFRSGQIYSEG